MKMLDRRLLSAAFGSAIALTLALVPGCGKDGNSITEIHSVASDSELASYGKEQDVPRMDASTTDATEESLSAEQGIVAPTVSRDTNRIAHPGAFKRKIIYNTHLDLIVQDYQSFELELPAMVQKFGGFIAKSKTKHELDGPQSGNWAGTPVRELS